MGARFSSISAKIKQHCRINFLFAPIAGLVLYVFVLCLTQPSPLQFAGPIEQVFTVFTMTFLAVVMAFFLAVSLAAAQAYGNEAIRGIARKAEVYIFAFLMTLLAVIMIENFTYTMFRFGIKNTDTTIAKIIYLVMAFALFWMFSAVGAHFRQVLQDKPSAMPALVGVSMERAILSGLFAGINLLGNISAQASHSAAYTTPYNVVILSSDGINASSVSAYGYKRKTTPFLDSVKSEFLMAQSAYPNNGHTTGAITSLLTGMLPTQTKVVFPPDSLSGENAYRSLPRLLRNQGYRTNNIAVPHYADAAEQNILQAFDRNNNAMMIGTSLPIRFSYRSTNWFINRFLGEAVGLTQDVLWLGEMPNPFSQVDGQERGTKYGFNDRKRLRELVQTFSQNDRPFFVNSHFLGTHGPRFNPEVIYFSRGKTPDPHKWPHDLYDDAILTFDSYIKRVYTKLRDQGLLERTILVILSDHGIGHDPRKKVPLMIRFPNKDHAGVEIASNVQVIDIAPTVIDYLGGTVPDWMQGDSLIANKLAADRQIFSASVSKIGFVPKVGVLSPNKGRYGTMDYFYLAQCDETFKLDVYTQEMTVQAALPPTNQCSEAQQLTTQQAKKAMQDHLAENYQ